MDTRAALEDSSSKQWKHDVFLSFRGKDTRRTFTDNLYWALKHDSVNVFRDEENLQRGETIRDELVEAIERSQIAIIVFSKGYADSRWCLEELETIMKCRTTMGQTVLPIFYDIDPSHVRGQTDSFAEPFQKYERRYPKDKVLRWRDALTQAGRLAGGNLENTDGYEGRFIRKIVDDVTRRLNNTYSGVAANQVGIDSRVQLIINELDIGGSDDVRIIGILGMGGTGKSTVAQAIISRFRQRFDATCFLSKVREGDMVKLQNKLLCDILKPANVEVSTVNQGTEEIERRLGSKKVLVVIDDVDCAKQLHQLAIKRDTFGPGSRIIITTRVKQLLKIFKVDKTCNAQIMNKQEAFELFCCHAFTERCPPDKEYLELSSKVVDYCGGLPLALEVLGSYLCTKLKSEWKSALSKLRTYPHMQIHEQLKISYDGLIDDDVKDIFLDISCFFIGMNKDHVTTILDGCDFNPEIGIGELHDRCLVAIDEGNNLIMHDLLRDMGRQIVRAKSPKIPGKRCRLWDQDDVKDVLRNKSGTEEVEGLMLDLQESDKPIFCTEALKEMQGLRLLKLKGVKFTGNCQHLSKKLRWLCWSEFPLKIIPEDFNQSYLVDIDLSHSEIQFWNDSDVPLEKLKFLNLGYCRRLKRSPDFSKLPNLEKLLLNDCESLSRIHPSIVQLKNLKHLSLANCNLKNDAIPKDLGGLSSLEVLDLRGNNFNVLPTLSGLSKLQPLQWDNCKNLEAIPDLPKKLEILEPDECAAKEKVPDFSHMLSVMGLHQNHFPEWTEIPGMDKLSDSVTRIPIEGCTACDEIILQVLSLSLRPSLSCTHKCIS
ncbi:disease resistance protein RUN1-like isoform X1 [Malus sylvestris]|uniref:disease resistance protein RUN1-like isoform X1 n=1 Tax=Malus sylvestris TaxID=3752 RepID=UPI0021ACD1B5|nr:disease resistance protein RUN1-like isoform X1 [Malus sylvestris]